MHVFGSDAPQGGKASDSQDRKLNSTHSLLRCTGASQQLTSTNTIFCLANKRKVLWMHLRSQQWLLTDRQPTLPGLDLRLRANDRNWKHSKFLETTGLRSHRKHLLNMKMDTCPGVLCSNAPNGILYQWVPN